MKLNYVTNVLKPIDKYCTHKKTQPFVFKEAVSSNSLWFPLVLKTEAGTTNYSVFTPSLNVRMKILSYSQSPSWSSRSKPPVPFEDIYLNLWRHTGQDRPFLVALSCQSNLRNLSMIPPWNSHWQGESSWKNREKGRSSVLELCWIHWKPVGSGDQYKQWKITEEKCYKETSKQKQCNIAEGFVKTDHVVEHLITRQNTHTMRIISVWTPWILVSFFFFI